MAEVYRGGRGRNGRGLHTNIEQRLQAELRGNNGRLEQAPRRNRKPTVERQRDAMPYVAPLALRELITDVDLHDMLAQAKTGAGVERVWRAPYDKPSLVVAGRSRIEDMLCYIPDEDLPTSEQLEADLLKNLGPNANTELPVTSYKISCFGVEDERVGAVIGAIVTNDPRILQDREHIVTTIRGYTDAEVPSSFKRLYIPLAYAKARHSTAAYNSASPIIEAYREQFQQYDAFRVGQLNYSTDPFYRPPHH